MNKVRISKALKKSLCFLPGFILFSFVSCTTNSDNDQDNMIKLMTLDPGHFHAALIQKNMYEELSPEVYVYAPEGNELDQHLAMIRSYNRRDEDPTSWQEIVYTGKDFFERMLAEQPGNVVVLAGNNRKKTDYIVRSVGAGLNVLADKPMVINPAEFPRLEEAFRIAENNSVLLYDIMTERYEITTMLQKALSQDTVLFGKLVGGSPSEPAVTKESVHHFFKYVSGSPLIRPPWYFDTEQQGEGLADVTTHLVDLIQWECYPGTILSKEDIEIVDARRWPTVISTAEFCEVTGLDEIPAYLRKDTAGGLMHIYANGEINYRIKDSYARVLVEWKYRAPEGTGDTHYSIMRGSRCDLVISQGAEEGYQPVLYLRAKNNTDITEKKLAGILAGLPWDGISAEKTDARTWRFIIPDKFRESHEEHFTRVTEKYIDYLEKGKLPEWEVANMITKYYTTTEAIKKALE